MPRCSGMKNLDTLFSGRKVDDVASPNFVGIAGCGDYGRNSTERFPIGIARATERVAPSDGDEQLEQRRIYERQDRLRLRIAEPAIEFDDLRTLVGNHQPRVQQPLEWRSRLAHRR